MEQVHGVHCGNIKANGCQQIIVKSPRIVAAYALVPPSSNIGKVTMCTIPGPQFLYNKLFQAPLNDDPLSNTTDTLLLQEYEEWKQHSRLIDYLYEIRLRGCITLQFSKACTQVV